MNKETIERGFERALFMSRWLMAPIYAGLVLALGLLVVVFAREAWEQALHVHEMSVETAIVAVLSLIDLSLGANLLIIVVFAGYGNFVSKIDVNDHEDRPPWMQTIDFSTLKIKLIASIVAISAVRLLKSFMGIGEGEEVSEREIYMLLLIHLTFVVSGVLLAFMDWLSDRAAKH